jgi:hypothetical protein
MVDSGLIVRVGFEETNVGYWKGLVYDSWCMVVLRLYQLLVGEYGTVRKRYCRCYGCFTSSTGNIIIVDCMYLLQDYVIFCDVREFNYLIGRLCIWANSLYIVIFEVCITAIQLIRFELILFILWVYITALPHRCCLTSISSLAV